MRTMALMLLCGHRAIDGARKAQFLRFGSAVTDAFPTRDFSPAHGCFVSSLANNH
jgi:hypothetical protein